MDTHKPLRSLSGLIDFDSAARWSSFKQAAHELHKTPAAVSQNIRQLEDALGFALFERRTRGLALTDAGTELAATVAKSLKDISQKVQQLRDGDGAMRLRVSATHSFAMKWLVPRLHRFAGQHPEIDLRMESTDQAVDMEAGTCDIAIRYARHEPAHAQVRLWAERRIVVCSPRLLRGRDAKPGARPRPTVLARYPLLYEGGTADWLRLLSALGMADRRVDFARSYSHSGLLVQAAVAAHGMALAPYSLAHEDLCQGRLLWLAELEQPSDYGYWLLCAPGREALPRVTAFRRWIEAEMATMAAPPREG